MCREISYWQYGEGSICNIAVKTSSLNYASCSGMNSCLWHDGHPGFPGLRNTLLKESHTWISSIGQIWFERIFMITGLWLSFAKNNDKILMSTDLGFVAKMARENVYFWQITKINESVFWPTQILGVVWYLECPAGYERAEWIDSSEPKVVRGILISLRGREMLEWPPDWKRLDNFPVLEKSQRFVKSWLTEIG